MLNAGQSVIAPVIFVLSDHQDKDILQLLICLVYRCYLFDSQAFLLMDPDFLTAGALDESRYDKVTMGRKEGEVMKHLVNKHHFFIRKESIEYQGSCRITPSKPKVCYRRNLRAIININHLHKLLLKIFPKKGGSLQNSCDQSNLLCR